MLPNPRRIGERRHHPALPYGDVPALMARLGTTPGAASTALQFTILTAARSGETLGMTWAEIDFDTATWSIPASRMKMKQPHDVPFSDQALDILRNQHTPIREIGLLLHEGWRLKRELADSVSTPQIDEIYERAKGAGALGGKVLGAGGGGFFLFYCEPHHKEGLRRALGSLTEVPFGFDSQGNKVIYVGEEAW